MREFIYKIHSFKVNFQWFFLVYSELCNYHNWLTRNIFITLTKKPHATEASVPPPRPQGLSPANLPFLCGSAYLANSYKQNQTI